MKRIYSYVLRYDDGAAPNPFWNICTLTICKPLIRKNAEIGDWIIGTGSKNSKCNDGNTKDFSDKLVYAMKVTDIKTLQEYDDYCKSKLFEKIPVWNSRDWQKKVGDCIYDYSKGNSPLLRPSVHNEGNRETDLKGENALMSNHFFYFGENPVLIPNHLTNIIKQNQGHKKICNEKIVEQFELWIDTLKKPKIMAVPQMKWLLDKLSDKNEISKCAKNKLIEDQNDAEEVVC